MLDSLNNWVINVGESLWPKHWSREVHAVLTGILAGTVVGLALFGFTLFGLLVL